MKKKKEKKCCSLCCVFKLLFSIDPKKFFLSFYFLFYGGRVLGKSQGRRTGSCSVFYIDINKYIWIICLYVWKNF